MAAQDKNGSPVSNQAVYAELDAERRAALRAYWSTLVRCVALLPVLLLPIAGLAFVMSTHEPTSPWHDLVLSLRERLGPFMSFVVLGSIVWVFGGLFLLSRYFVRRGRQPGWDYVRRYKQRVLTQFCHDAFDGLAYDPDGYVGYDVFDATRLFPYRSDVYRSEDGFSGKVGSTDIRFAEAVAQRERRDWLSKNQRKYYQVFFKGLVVVADFHKHFHSTTRLVPQGSKVDSAWRQRRIDLEDPEFTEAFDTLSDDEIDVRYVLSTSMMQRFVALGRRFHGMRALFRNDELWLLLPMAYDLFEPSLYRSADCSRQLARFERDIRGVLEVIEELDLNTRIWSKA